MSIEVGGSCCHMFVCSCSDAPEARLVAAVIPALNMVRCAAGHCPTLHRSTALALCCHQFGVVWRSMATVLGVDNGSLTAAAVNNSAAPDQPDSCVAPLEPPRLR
jgi:hypothetical protein